MKTIVIIGGGFAGVWSALAAAETRRGAGATSSDLRIELINPRDTLVLRPRLYEADPASMVIPLADVLRPVEVVHRNATATAIDTVRQRIEVVAADGQETALGYDALVLATGSELDPPPAFDGRIHDIDTVEAAVALERHLIALAEHRPGQAQPRRSQGRWVGPVNAAGLATVVVVGSGFTGIELATELVDRLARLPWPPGVVPRVVLVERDETVAHALGAGPQQIIVDALEQLDIEVRTSGRIIDYDGSEARLDTGEVIATSTVVWTAGMRANPLTRQLPGPHDHLGRLMVDQRLAVAGLARAFAAGDSAAPLDGDGHIVTQSCQHAMPQGTCAGRNAVAALLGLPLATVDIGPYVTCLDLGPAGAVFTRGWDRQVELTGTEAKSLKRMITTQAIYPRGAP